MVSRTRPTCLLVEKSPLQEHQFKSIQWEPPFFSPSYEIPAGDRQKEQQLSITAPQKKRLSPIPPDDDDTLFTPDTIYLCK